MTRIFSRMCLIGCGLIGGSLALALRKAEVVRSVVGVDVNENHLSVALKRGAITESAASLDDGLRGADLVVIAAPIPNIIELIAEIGEKEDLLAPDAIVTDTGSAKEAIMEAARTAFSRAAFIGGHPMAGSEKSGIGAAHADLMENAIYVLTPPAGIPDRSNQAVESLQRALHAVGARVKILAPDRHDRVVAAISHVPHVIATTLVNQVASKSDGEFLYAELAAGGFRDITRIASSEPELWRDIVLANPNHIEALLDEWFDALSVWRKSIADGDASRIARLFHEARTFRDALPVKATGAIRAVYSLIVSVPDEPGVIGRIASLLGDHGISLRNIGILESREEDDGQLLLQFDTSAFSERALEILCDHGYAADDRI